MKKIITIGIMSMFLLAGLTTVSAVEMKTVGYIKSSENGYNFWIEDVTYEPDPDNSDITIFTVLVGAEGVPAGATLHPHVQLCINEQLHDMNVVTFLEDGIQTCQENGYNIDFSEDLVEIEVDPENIYNETNENDNLWTLFPEDLPDFIVGVLEYTYNKQQDIVVVKIGISNERASIEEGIYVDVNLTLDSDKKTISIQYTGTGPSSTVEVNMNYDKAKITHLLIAEVDPSKKIIELNENNNIKSINVKSSIENSNQNSQSTPQSNPTQQSQQISQLISRQIFLKINQFLQTIMKTTSK